VEKVLALSLEAYQGTAGEENADGKRPWQLAIARGCSHTVAGEPDHDGNLPLHQAGLQRRKFHSINARKYASSYPITNVGSARQNYVCQISHGDSARPISKSSPTPSQPPAAHSTSRRRLFFPTSSCGRGNRGPLLDFADHCDEPLERWLPKRKFLAHNGRPTTTRCSTTATCYCRAPAGP